MHEAVQDALNQQIKHEFDSAYAYLQTAAYFESINLTGFAGWMREQSEEEVGHAMKLFDFMIDRGARVTLLALDQPRGAFTSPRDAFTQALRHEQTVTGQIHELYAMAVEQRDYSAQVLLQWFISEQVEEEKTATQIVEQLKLAGDDPTALLLLDRELGGRGSGQSGT